MNKRLNLMTAHFIYLDGQQERDELTERICTLRDEVIYLAEQVPEAHHYTPRCHNELSLAVVLARLQAFDTAALWLVRAASNGYTLRVPRYVVNGMDSAICRMLNKRLVDVTIGAIRRKEVEICEFVQTVPIGVLSQDVVHPGRKQLYTVEQAIQMYFVDHWQYELDKLKQVDGVTTG